MSAKDCCCGCENDNLKKLKEIIEENKDAKGPLIGILQEAQLIYGYLPEDALKFIAEELDIPLAEVYGVVTFYTQFSLKPKGKYNISVCMGTPCYVKGANNILEEFKKLLGIEVGDCTEDGKFSLEACRCIGACGLAPVLTINEDVHGRLVVDDVKGIVEIYKNKD